MCFETRPAKAWKPRYLSVCVRGKSLTGETEKVWLTLYRFHLSVDTHASQKLLTSQTSSFFSIDKTASESSLQ